MTKETKFYTWLIVGLVVAGGVAWYVMRNRSPAAAPSGAHLTP